MKDPIRSHRLFRTMNLGYKETAFTRVPFIKTAFMDDDFIDPIMELPVIQETEQDLEDAEEFGPVGLEFDIEFLKSCDFLFMYIRQNGRRYLIDTQGYEYARYIIELR